MFRSVLKVTHNSQIADGGDLESQIFGLITKFNKMQKATTNNETPAIGNVLLAEVPKVQGIIMIDFTVQCPHCDENIYQSMDREWFEKTMGHSFPTDGVDGDYEAECPECKKYFTIEGFCQ